MSETQAPAEALPPEPIPAPEPQPETPQQPPEQETPEEQRERERSPRTPDQRIANLRARLGAAERERDRQAAELQVYRQQIAQLAPQEETQEQRQARHDAEIFARAEAKIRAERFHEEGKSAFADWDQRCSDLIGMGADPGFAQLLVEMPEGVRVAGALANDPSEVQRIAGLRSERARAIALGKYAATLAAEAPAAVRQPDRNVTRAPAPIKPVTARSSPVFNEYTASPEELVEHYMRQQMERQKSR